MNSSFSGYLATFYIYEEFRNSGIATYLFTNLNKLLKYSLNINLRCLCTFPQPQKPEEWSNIDNNEMKKIMINISVKNGFKPVGKKNYYVKEYKVL